MQKIAMTQTMRQIWEAMKLFHVPMTHEYIQNLNEFDLEFIDWSYALDKPGVMDKLRNTVYDEDFDDYVNEVANDDLTEEEAKMMEDIISKQKDKDYTQPEKLPTEEDNDEFTPLDAQNGDNVDDWEDVE